MPKRVDHDVRRRQITDAVCRITVRGGVGAATFREVAAEAGVSVRLVERMNDKGYLPVIPHEIPFGTIVGFNGGDRVPAYANAPQFIRQLWVVVTKPRAAIEATAADLTIGQPDKLQEKLTEQLDTYSRLLQVAPAAGSAPSSIVRSSCLCTYRAPTDITAESS